MGHLKEKEPELNIEQAVDVAHHLIKWTKMCFVLKDLEYLRTGGRTSNIMALEGRILSLHPCIEIIDGYRHQWIKLQKIWRSVHFIQRRGHAEQAHFVQFSQKRVEECFSGEHHLSPPFPLR